MGKNKNKGNANKSTPAAAKPAPTPAPPKPVAAAAKPKKGPKTWKSEAILRQGYTTTRARWFADVLRANAAGAAKGTDVPALIEAVMKAAGKFDDAVGEFLKSLPDDYKGVDVSVSFAKPKTPKEPKAPKAPKAGAFVAGSAVQIKTENLAAFADLFTDDELASLTVLGVKGKQVLLQTATGGRIAIPAKQLIVSAPVAAAA